jgi:hypothetical protein
MVFSFTALFDSEIENLTDHLSVSRFVSTTKHSQARTHTTRLRASARVIQFVYMQFRKRPVVIRAVEWRGDNWDEIAAFHRCDHFTTTTNYLNIATLEGVMQACPGDWIIEGVQGEVYPCKPDIFEQTYEPLDVSTLGLAEQP